MTLEADPKPTIDPESRFADVAEAAASWRADLLRGRTRLQRFIEPKRLVLLVVFVAAIAWAW